MVQEPLLYIVLGVNILISCHSNGLRVITAGAKTW